MKEYTLTNTTKELTDILDKRGIVYVIDNDGKSMSVWAPSDQFLFMLGQDYEQLRIQNNNA